MQLFILQYQIYKVWQENQRIKSEVRELEQAVEAKGHAMVLDQVLKAQVKCRSNSDLSHVN